MAQINKKDILHLQCGSPCHELAIAAYPDLTPFVYKSENPSQIKVYMRRRLQEFATENGTAFTFMSPLCKPCVSYSKFNLSTSKIVAKQGKAYSSNRSIQFNYGTMNKTMPKISKSGQNHGKSEKKVEDKSLNQGCLSLPYAINDNEVILNITSVGKDKDACVSQLVESPKRKKIPKDSPVTNNGYQSGHVPQQEQDNSKSKIPVKLNLTENKDLNERTVDNSRNSNPKINEKVKKSEEKSINRLSTTSEPQNAVRERTLIEKFNNTAVEDRFDQIKSDLKEQETLAGIERRINRARKQKQDDFINVVMDSFERRSLEKILSVVLKGDETFFLAKLLGMEKLQLIRREDANVHYPQEVISFYEPLIKWSTPIESEASPTKIHSVSSNTTSENNEDSSMEDNEDAVSIDDGNATVLMDID